MIYSPPLIEARLVRRHKRFLADVTLPDGSLLRAHCPNTGAMTGCSEPGSRVWLMDSGNERRKYRHTLELVASGEYLVCVNTARANQVVAAAIEDGLIPPLAGYASWRREPAIPGGKGRFDLKLWDPAKGEC
ncbi:MAG: DNA/RNA nuclease SfsA, partial [Gammaproteobacteria bacterium]|nr:DNA/RNA nuclease SfsA [Gammaproteobacteria bacterium]